MNFKAMYTKVDKAAHCLSRKLWLKKHNKHHYDNLKKAGIPVRKLNESQKKQVQETWGVKDYSTHELIYSITGKFDPDYCPISVFSAKLEFKLNEQKFVTAWSDKNYFDRFFPDVRFPKAIVRNIAGVFYDSEYNKICEADVLNILSNYDKVCIKPSLDSGIGRGVKLVEIDENISDVIKKYKSDYIIQEVLGQHAVIKAFNPSSVNVLRVCSLFINNKTTMLSASLRCGAEGHFNDNSITADGKGMFVIGIGSDGQLEDTAYYPCGQLLKAAPNGTSFAGVKIPSFESVEKLVATVHEKMPFAGFVGFDIAFAEDGTPVVMEYNLKAPGVFYYQLANGPLFGNRTQEIIDTFLNKKQS